MSSDKAYVQYIVVRKDLVKQMGYGKTAAQVAHASLGVLLKDRQLRPDDTIQEWLTNVNNQLKVKVLLSRFEGERREEG